MTLGLMTSVPWVPWVPSVQACSPPAPVVQLVLPEPHLPAVQGFPAAALPWQVPPVFAVSAAPPLIGWFGGREQVPLLPCVQLWEPSWHPWPVYVELPERRRPQVFVSVVSAALRGAG